MIVIVQMEQMQKVVVIKAKGKTLAFFIFSVVYEYKITIKY